MHAHGTGLQAGLPYGLYVQLWLSPFGVPCNQPPLGTIRAVDLVTGKLLWQVPSGTTKDTGPFGIATHLPMPVGMPAYAGTSAAYAAAKGGVKLLTQTLAIDYAAKGIRVNAVCPGYIDTPLLKAAPEGVKDALVKLHPMGRLGRAEEVARTVLFLASEDATFVTGASLLVDGGYTAQ